MQGSKQPQSLAMSRTSAACQLQPRSCRGRAQSRPLPPCGGLSDAGKAPCSKSHGIPLEGCWHSQCLCLCMGDPWWNCNRLWETHGCAEPRTCSPSDVSHRGCIRTCTLPARLRIDTRQQQLRAVQRCNTPIYYPPVAETRRSLQVTAHMCCRSASGSSSSRCSCCTEA